MSPNWAIEPTESGLEFLAWDSNHFGFLVGRLPEENIDDLELTKGLESARRANYRLVYWATRPDRAVSERLLADYAGRLVDRRAVYEMAGLDAQPTHLHKMPVSGYRILRQPPGNASPRLIALGIAAGADSRFLSDKRIRREQFESLYEIWVQRSTSRELADEVLVAVPNEGQEIGLVTIKVRDGVGQIGLIAVAEEARCRGVGSQLVLAAHRWMAKNGAVRAKVITQSCNQAACRLYSQLGYHLFEVSNIYHFWPLEKSHGSSGS